MGCGSCGPGLVGSAALPWPCPRPALRATIGLAACPRRRESAAVFLRTPRPHLPRGGFALRGASAPARPPRRRWGPPGPPAAPARPLVRAVALRGRSLAPSDPRPGAFRPGSRGAGPGAVFRAGALSQRVAGGGALAGPCFPRRLRPGPLLAALSGRFPALRGPGFLLRAVRLRPACFSSGGGFLRRGVSPSALLGLAALRPGALHAACGCVLSCAPPPRRPRWGLRGAVGLLGKGPAGPRRGAAFRGPLRRLPRGVAGARCRLSAPVVSP